MEKKYPEVEVRFNCQEIITLGKVIQATNMTLKMALANATIEGASPETLMEITEAIIELEPVEEAIQEVMDTIKSECCPNCVDNETVSELS